MRTIGNGIIEKRHVFEREERRGLPKNARGRA